MNQDWIEQNIIYKVYAGSIAYGLDSPESDQDIRGITVPPEEYFLGLKNFEQKEDRVHDEVTYGIRKFVRLLSQCNPNIIELLWVQQNHIIYIDEFGKRLRENRDLFLTKRARYTFGGYAFAQLQKIKSHRKWLVNPVSEPKKIDFFKEKIMILEDGSKAYEKFLEQEYDVACKKYKQYLDWQKNRNPERKELEDKYKYDTKHGMHLIRLLRMGLEILLDGKVEVFRHDAKQLREIRNGEWSYEKLISEAEIYEKLLDEAYVKSELPKFPDMEKIDRLLIEIIKDFWKSHEK